MHDIRLIRENPAAFDAGLARRGVAPVATEVLALDAHARERVTRAQALQAERNEASKAIGRAKAAKDEAAAAALMARVAAIKDEAAALETAGPDEVATLLATIPNLPAADVPEGADEAGNVEQKRWPVDDRTVLPPLPRGVNDAGGVREHFDIGAALGLDFESAQAVSGARFAYLRGQVARLSRALGQFMLDTHTTRFGYEEVAPPVLVRDEALFGTAQLPKFEADLFATDISFNPQELYAFKHTEWLKWCEAIGMAQQDAPSLIEKDVWNNLPSPNTRRWLIPTAEVSLTNLVREKILAEEELPLRFTALTPCFRSEAGAAGRDTRGLIRQHQFDKVELVSITTPEQSDAEHERMTAAAEHILEALGLPYRRMLLCTGDMGFSARKTYDLEVWLPGQRTYREISSCSNCGDFQARRMEARFRPAGQQKGTRLVHTLNGSALAVGRTLVAVLENYQRADGSVEVPAALRPWMGGIEALTPAG